MIDPMILTAASGALVAYRAARWMLAPRRVPVVVPKAQPPAIVTRPRGFDFPLFTPYRGAHRTTQEEVARYLLTAHPGPLYSLAGTMWPARKFLNKLTLVTGRPDSGKTVMLRMMMVSVAELFHLLQLQCQMGLYPGEGQMRWLVVDPTNAYLQLLDQVVPGDVPIVRATPVDAGGMRWDIAADINSDSMNDALQSGLFPESLAKKSNDPFWYTMARKVTSSVINCYHDQGSDWQFHDLIVPIKYPQYLRPLLAQSPRTRGMAESELVGRLGRDIITTASSVLDRMAIAAALWRKATGTFSLRQFLDSRQVLHFAYTPDLIPSLAGIANAMTHVLVLLGISRNDPYNHTLLWLDEGRYLSDLAGLEDLAARGRGAGFGAIYAAQGTPGLINKWGEGRVKELLDLVSTWVALSSGPDTAEAFCRAVGEVEGLQKSYGYSYTNGYSETHSTSWGKSGSHSYKGGSSSGWSSGGSSSRTTSSSQTYSENFSLVTKKAILPSELTGLPYASEQNDNICGFAFNPEVGAFEFDAPFLSHFRGLPPPRLGPMPLRPDRDQRLMPWTREDFDRLKLKPDPDLIDAMKTTYDEMGGAL